MNNTKIPALGWGLHRAVPDDATAAWGCRLIVDQNGMVDFLGDRQDFQGGKDFLATLDARFPLSELQDTVSDLLRSHAMTTREPEPFVLFQDDDLAVVADTNGSAGYCYVAAWTTR